MTTTGTALERRCFFAAPILCALTMYSSASLADNPIVQTIYTADPAPMVYDGRLYVYTGHDEDTIVNNFFTMNEWRVYSTKDVVNWTDHGSPLRYSNFTWAKGDAWAGQCIPRNGKFYYYVPMTRTSGGMAIGVAVSTSPTGPFTDALGKALVSTGTGDIDPTVFIDDDGQAYLYWGNPNLWYVKLNADMISYTGSPVQVNLTTAGFGTRKDTTRATSYEEGPWFYKRGSLYYMVFAANGIPEQISYATSSPTGPWTFRGVIMTAQGASFTNHAGIVDFGGNSYFFYHNGALTGGGGYHRSTAIERFAYSADGTIPSFNMTTAGPPGVGNLNPYELNEAETIAWESGIETEVCSEGGMNVTAVSNGDYIKVKGVNFGAGATSFKARVASASTGGNIEIRLDSQTGTLVGTCAVSGTGGRQVWATTTCTVSGATGIHDLFFKFAGSASELFNFNNWQFTGTGGGTAGTGGAGGAGGTSTSGGAPTTGGSSAGGAVATGGGSSTGGARPTGGSSATGGTLSTGGNAPIGGSKTTGGTTAASIGGTGVTSTTGGSLNGSSGTGAATGGNMNTNGGNASGGQQSSGGVLAVGGASAVGGNLVSSGTMTWVGGTGAAISTASVKGDDCGCRVAGERSSTKLLGAFILYVMQVARRRSVKRRRLPQRV